MTLRYYTEQELNLPDEAFDAKGVAKLIIDGSSAGGVWNLGVRSTHLPPDDNTLFGELETEEAPLQPDQAIDAAEAWLREECARLGLQVVGFASLNEHYANDPSAVGYFASGMGIVRRAPT